MRASFWTLWNRLFTIGGRSIAAGSCTIAIEAAKADSTGRRNTSCQEVGYRKTEIGALCAA